MLLFFYPLMGSGCWDQREPDLLGIVDVLAFDYEPEMGTFKVIALVANPTAGPGADEQNGNGQGGGAFWVVEAAGKTVFEAIKSLDILSTRKLVYTHVEVIVFSEELAKRGIGPVLDFIDRERQSRLISIPLVVQGDVRQFLETSFPLEELGGQAITRQMESVRIERSVVPEIVSIRLLFHHLSAPGQELILPRGKVLTEVDKNDGAEEGEADSQEHGQVNPIELSGAALFNGDKLVGFMDEKETSGHQLITGNIQRATVVLPCPVSEGDFLAVEVFDFIRTIEPVIDEERVRIKLTLKAEGRIQDFSCPTPVLDESFIESLNSRFAAEIEKRMKASLEKARQTGSDVFGLGNLVYRTRYPQWQAIEQAWPQIFSTLEVDLDVEAVIRRHGLILERVRIR